MSAQRGGNTKLATDQVAEFLIVRFLFATMKAYAYNILRTSQALDARCLKEIFE